MMFFRLMTLVKATNGCYLLMVNANTPKFQIDQLIEEGILLRARSLYRHSAGIFKLALGQYDENSWLDSKIKARLLDEIGNSYFCLGDYAQAKNYYLGALEITERRWHKEHPNLTPVLDHLCQLCLVEGTFEQALPHCKRSLAIKEKCLAAANANVLESMRMCAIIETELGNYKQAQYLLEAGISVLKPTTIGPVEEFVYVLARVNEKQGKDEKAESLYKEAIDTFTQRAGRAGRLAHCLRDYAEFVRKQGRHEDAESLLKKAKSSGEGDKAMGLNDTLPNSDCYQRLVYPVSTFH
jgi:tetratricopeptide (TPR) repeat protein